MEGVCIHRPRFYRFTYARNRYWHIPSAYALARPAGVAPAKRSGGVTVRCSLPRVGCAGQPFLLNTHTWDTTSPGCTSIPASLSSVVVSPSRPPTPPPSTAAGAGIASQRIGPCGRTPIPFCISTINTTNQGRIGWNYCAISYRISWTRMSSSTSINSNQLCTYIFLSPS